jgi:hypothetical protein
MSAMLIRLKPSQGIVIWLGIGLGKTGKGMADSCLAIPEMLPFMAF